MLKVGVTLLAALVISGTAGAATGQAEWTRGDAKAADRALGYPKPHPRKVSCRGIGIPGAGGLYSMFRCRNTYRHGRHRIVYLIDDKTGWVCAGYAPTGCHILKRGFVSNGEITRLGGMGESANQASGAYILNHYGTGAVGDGCTRSAPGVWGCVFTNPAVTVTVTYKKVKGGWTLRAT